MEKFIDSIIGKTLRWILFLPLSILVLLIIDFITGILIRNISFLDPLNYSTMSLIFYSALRGGVPGYAFVYIGTNIVPNFKKFVSILLSFLIIVLNVLSIVATGYEGYIDDGVFGVLSSWQNIIRNIATIIGAVIAVVTIYEE